MNGSMASGFKGVLKRYKSAEMKEEIDRLVCEGVEWNSRVSTL
jgi:hypothetical protein